MSNLNASAKFPQAFTVQASVTRPADTTAYAAKDAISDATSSPSRLTFSDVAREAGFGGTIVGVTLASSVAGTTNADFDLVLFDEAITALEDNVAADPTDAELQTCIGVVPFANADAVDLSVNKVWFKEVTIPFVTGASNILDGALVAAAAYTPASAEVFTITLHIIKD